MKTGLVGIICSGALLVASIAAAQDTSLKLQILSGKDGNPLPLQRVVIFGGKSPEGPRFHDLHFGATTDKDGLAVVTVDASKVKWIQVWVDGLVLCQEKPNFNSFEVHLIQAIGLSSPNTCSGLKRVTTPGTFTVYARPPTFAERMGR